MGGPGFPMGGPSGALQGPGMGPNLMAGGMGGMMPGGPQVRGLCHANEGSRCCQVKAAP